MPSGTSTPSAVVCANPHCPEIINLFEAEGRMPRIRFQKRVVLVRQIAYRYWERAMPKIGGGIMGHSLRALPAWKSARKPSQSACQASLPCGPQQSVDPKAAHHTQGTTHETATALQAIDFGTCCSSCSTALIECPCYASRPYSLPSQDCTCSPGRMLLVFSSGSVCCPTRRQPLPEVGATQERTLEAVGWTPWLGLGSPARP